MKRDLLFEEFKQSSTRLSPDMQSEVRGGQGGGNTYEASRYVETCGSSTHSQSDESDGTMTACSDENDC